MQQPIQLKKSSSTIRTTVKLLFLVTGPFFLPLRYENNNLLGIGFMLLAMFLFETMDALVKWLVVADHSVILILFIRSWLIVGMILLYLGWRGQLSMLRTRRPVQHAVRGMIGFLAPFCFFLALKTLPLADATVVFFSSTFILTAGSAIFFRERVGPHRWSAVVIGFGGVMIAMNPGGGGEISAYLLVLIATTVYAALFLSGKYLSREDSVMLLVFSFNLGVGVVASLALPWVWQPVPLEVLLQIAVLSVIAFAGHFAFNAAFAHADVSVLAPFEYFALVWATLIGYLIWRDIPALEVWIGAVIITACGLYVVHRESLRRKAQ